MRSFTAPSVEAVLAMIFSLCRRFFDSALARSPSGVWNSSSSSFAAPSVSTAASYSFFASHRRFHARMCSLITYDFWIWSLFASIASTTFAVLFAHVLLSFCASTMRRSSDARSALSCGRRSASISLRFADKSAKSRSAFAASERRSSSSCFQSRSLFFTLTSIVLKSRKFRGSSFVPSRTAFCAAASFSSSAMICFSKLASCASLPSITLTVAFASASFAFADATRSCATVTSSLLVSRSENRSSCLRLFASIACLRSSSDARAPVPDRARRCTREGEREKKNNKKNGG